MSDEQPNLAALWAFDPSGAQGDWGGLSLLGAPTPPHSFPWEAGAVSELG